MTELNDMNLMNKFLKALGVLRGKSFAGRKMGFGPQAGFNSGMPGGPSMGQSLGPNWGLSGNQQPFGGWSMGSNQRMKMPGAGPTMGPQSEMVGNRQSLVRENLLTIIAEKPDGIRAKEIAQRAGINQSSVSESLSKLEDDCYLRRTVDPSDKRATLIFLTDLGKARASEVKEEQAAMFGHLFDSLTTAEKEELARLLDKIINGN